MNFKLGDKVRINAYLWKNRGGCKTKWHQSALFPVETGIIVGQRTLKNGHTECTEDGHTFYPSAFIKVYLVATNMATVRRVLSENIGWAE